MLDQIESSSTGPTVAPSFHTTLPSGRRVLKLRTLSVNEATTYRTCPELYRLSYVADGTGYETTSKSFSLIFGDYWHRAQEAWWLARIPPAKQEIDALADAYHAIDFPKPDAHGKVPPKLDPYDRARLRALMGLYHMRYWSDGVVPLAVEHSFVTPMLSPKGGRSTIWDGLDGRMDLVLRSRRGEDLVGEHKSTSLSIDDDSDYWDRVKFDMQISQYIEGAQATGFAVRGLVYDVIRKPHAQLKANKPESGESPDAFEARLFRAIAAEPDKYARRKLIVRTGHEMFRAREDTWATGQQIAWSHKTNLWPRHATSCSRYGHKCEFFEVCAGEVDVSASPRFKKKQKSNTHHPVNATKEIATV